MKRLFHLSIFVLIGLSPIVTSCGESNADKEARIAQEREEIRREERARLEQEKQEQARLESERREAERKEQERIQKEKEQQGRFGNATRNDFPSILSGTTWVTEKQDQKFSFNGNTATVYNSKPRRNYDDPLEWYNAGPNGFDNPPYIINFYEIQEPQKGLFKIQYRYDPSGTIGLFNFEVNGNNIYYCPRNSGGKRLLLKEV